MRVFYAQPECLYQTLSHAYQPPGAARVSVPNLEPRQSASQCIFDGFAWPKVSSG